MGMPATFGKPERFQQLFALVSVRPLFDKVTKTNFIKLIFLSSGRNPDLVYT